jgi:hypothetical protein
MLVTSEKIQTESPERKYENYLKSKCDLDPVMQRMGILRKIINTHSC